MKFILQENKEEFEFKSDKKNFDIRFNRIAFIFFIFFLISIIYCIHLTHLGSRDLNSNISKNYGSFNKIQRANILDRNNHFLAKTGLGLGLFIGKNLLEKNFASIDCRNSKTRSGAEVIVRWKNKDLFNI